MQVVQMLDELRQTMDYQRYLVRTCQYRMMLEVLSPYQFTILIVSHSFANAFERHTESCRKAPHLCQGIDKHSSILLRLHTFGTSDCITWVQDEKHTKYHY